MSTASTVQETLDLEAHADLRTRFALALAASIATAPVVCGDLRTESIASLLSQGMELSEQLISGLYDLADALAREDVRRRAKDGTR